VVAAWRKLIPRAHWPALLIGEQARIGARCVFLGGDHVGANCVVGADTHLFPMWCFIRARKSASASAFTPGSHRFGRFRLRSGFRRPPQVPQIGYVVIHDDVEIGANTTIDRGALGRLRLAGARRLIILSRSPTTLPSASIAWW